MKETYWSNSGSSVSWIFQYPLCRIDEGNWVSRGIVLRAGRPFSIRSVGSMKETNVRQGRVDALLAFQYPLCRIDEGNAADGAIFAVLDAFQYPLCRIDEGNAEAQAKDTWIGALSVSALSDR